MTILKLGCVLQMGTDTLSEEATVAKFKTEFCFPVFPPAGRISVGLIA